MRLMNTRMMVTVMIVIILITGCQTEDEVESNINNDQASEDKQTENNDHNLVNNESNENDLNYNNNHTENDMEDLNINDNHAENEEEDGSITDEMMVDPSIIVLVNKQHHLTAEDVPEDLVTVDVPTILDNPEVNQLRRVAADALKKMFEEAKKDNIYLYARSGYRSFETQTSLFQNYVKRNGVEAANRYSAKPGQSEHQTGLVMDITSESVNYQLTEEFGETKEGKWLAKHAHEFGFIIRYPKGAEHITGYIYEPWHFRYIGIDMATNIFQSNLTYEEFLEKEGIIDVVTK